MPGTYDELLGEVGEHGRHLAQSAARGLASRVTGSTFLMQEPSGQEAADTSSLLT